MLFFHPVMDAARTSSATVLTGADLFAQAGLEPVFCDMPQFLPLELLSDEMSVTLAKLSDVRTDWKNYPRHGLNGINAPSLT